MTTTEMRAKEFWHSTNLPLMSTASHDCSWYSISTAHEVGHRLVKDESLASRDLNCTNGDL